MAGFISNDKLAVYDFGRSGYNKGGDDGRGGYNKNDDGRGGYNARPVLNFGRPGEDDQDQGRSGYN